MSTDLALIEAKDFQQLLNQKVIIHFSPSIKVSAEVAEVSEFESYSLADRKPFSLVFLVETTTRFEQSTYIIEHPEKGMLHVFLVPISKEINGIKYQAIFS